MTDEEYMELVQDIEEEMKEEEDNIKEIHEIDNMNEAEKFEVAFGE